MGQLEQHLDNADGQREFLRQLESGNRLAFAYMKTKCKEWIENERRMRMVHEFRDAFLSMIFTSSEPNFISLCSFLEVLYLNNCAWVDLVQFLCSEPTERSTKVLNHLFNKYRTCPRSDALYTEIIRNIELTQDIFRRAYFESQSENKDILGMFYSLVYQDIHPFFEDNTDKFLNAFCILFRKKEMQQDICEIFNLFVTKYPECVDMTRVLGALLTNITGFEYLKYLVILNIAKRKNYPALAKFSAALSNVVKIGASISEAEMQDMKGDVLLYSRNLLRGYDANRGIVEEITSHLRKVFGEEWMKTLLVADVTSPMDEERLIFICLALKLRVKEVVDKCTAIVRNSKSISYLGVVSFRYLLSLGEYTDIDPGYISRNNPASFLAIAYLIRHIDKNASPNSLDSYPCINGKKYFSASEKIGGIEYHMEVMNKLMEFLKGEIEDEFSSQLMQKIIKIDTRVITPDVVKFMNEFTENNIRTINSPQAYSYLFDIHGIVFLNTGDSGFILGLVQTVLSEEVFEIYSSAFFLLAIVVMYSEGSFPSLVDVLGQESLWKTRELLLSLVCLTIALFKTGCCSKEQADYIAMYLRNINEHCSYILANSIATEDMYAKWIEGKDNVEEVFILATTLRRRNMIGMDVYQDMYSTSLRYFTENFISKKNVRRVLGSLRYGAECVGGKAEVQSVLEKNEQNIGHESIPFSAILAFGL